MDPEPKLEELLPKVEEEQEVQEPKKEEEEEEEPMDERTRELLKAAREADSDVTNGHPKEEIEDGNDSQSQPDGASTPAKKPRGRPKMSLSEKQAAKKNRAEELEDPVIREERTKKLQALLQRSSAWSGIMRKKMDEERLLREQEAAGGPKRGKGRGRPPAGAPKKRTGLEISDYIDESTIAAAEGSNQAAAAAAAAEAEGSSRKKLKGNEGSAVPVPITNPDKIGAPSKQPGSTEGRQPRLVTGATLRDYQIEGYEWLVGLYSQGLNGILADEMGLGKTLQTISFLAHLRDQGVWGPFLIVAPLSTIHNWILEFNRFTPTFPTLLYHGNQAQRKEMRNIHLKKPTTPAQELKFPVIVTSYEIVIQDRSFLAQHSYKYIIVDEGHRLKNMNCKLIRELKTYSSDGRLILTGTPLHNNLTELWSLLNFILPDIFDDLETFEKWFDFSGIHDEQSEKNLLAGGKQTIINQLHEILKPFLLRRLKTDVETNLPPKKEYLLYAPLTATQKDLYEAVVNHTIRDRLLERKTGMSIAEINEIREAPPMGRQETLSARSSRLPTPSTSSVPGTPGTGTQTPAEEGAPAVKRGVGRPRKSAAERLTESAEPSRRNTPRRSAAHVGTYQVDEADTNYFNRLEYEATHEPITPDLTPAAVARQGKEFAIKEAQKQINNMHLENVVMQLRKLCCHPFLFDWPVDPNTGTNIVTEDLINASGKMLMLNRLLDALFLKGHKVLIFSQFTTMLDIIEDWANAYKKIRTCRIDGNTSLDVRRSQIKDFNEGTGPDACNLFLLSTRAGGLGINLVSADTVIFYDSDWNPQMDLQAQDRVHRIGQTKPVLIYRLVSQNTVEQSVLSRAGNKRKLEALVIQQGQFKQAGGGGSSKNTIEAMAAELLKLKNEEIKLVSENDEIISDETLEALLDRSEAAYARESGWMSKIEGGSGATFEVTETKIDEGSEEVAQTLL